MYQRKAAETNSRRLNIVPVIGQFFARIGLKVVNRDLAFAEPVKFDNGFDMSKFIDDLINDSRTISWVIDTVTNDRVIRLRLLAYG